MFGRMGICEWQEIRSDVRFPPFLLLRGARKKIPFSSPSWVLRNQQRWNMQCSVHLKFLYRNIEQNFDQKEIKADYIVRMLANIHVEDYVLPSAIHKA